ncbi:hypothetical protein VTN96DRAFT_3366 [Rasamsonia emersonii]
MNDGDGQPFQGAGIRVGAARWQVRLPQDRQLTYLTLLPYAAGGPQEGPRLAALEREGPASLPQVAA